MRCGRIVLRIRAALLACMAASLQWSLGSAAANAQPPAPAAGSASAATSPADVQEQLLKEIQALRREVAEARALKDQVSQLKQELTGLRRAGLEPPTESPSTPPNLPPLPSASPPEPTGGELNRSRGGATLGERSSSAGVQTWEGSRGPFEANAPTSELSRTHPGATHDQAGPTEDVSPLRASYRYNLGTGALGGGGYFHIGDPDAEFVLNITNQMTIDGTFFDRQNMPTIEQGFNVPFARTFLYGNITKNWLYQIGTQGFLGQFNLLDMWMAYRFSDAFTVRFGKGLTPPLYEYYGFSPALEPVITNSPIFQLAGKRQLGVTALGNLFDNRLQYWSGVNNAGTSFWYALNRDVEYNGAVTVTPFKPSKNPLLEGLGAGLGLSVGEGHYSLEQNGISFINGSGEPTTNGSWITSSGVPFAVYNPNVVANGLRSRWSPHIFWYGRFSVLAEMMNFSRMLSDGSTSGRSTQWGYYVNMSYFLTGERDFAGNGFQGYSTVTPLCPFRPSKQQWGPGAWQVAAQFSELNTGRGDFQRGFIDPTRYTNRLDQVMVGLNWWPNKYTRFSLDWVGTYLNNPIPINGPTPVASFSTAWLRFAMFF